MQIHSPIYTEQELKGFDFSPWGGLDGFLKATSNGATAATKAVALKRLVPDLSRAVDMTAAAVSSLPFVIQNENGDTVDDTADWKNTIGGMPNPRRIIYLLASALCGGAAYLIPFRTPKLIYDLQYAAPHTITPQININGLQYFDRATDTGQAARYSPKEIIYFWLPDSDVEIGPALNTPLSNAMNNAELILNMDNTMRTYGERGFVPITLLGAAGMPGDDERKKAEGFFDRLLKGGFDVLAKIVNSEKLTLIKVGAGLEELKGSYIEIKREARESIAQAFGIPSALFMSDNAFASEMSALTRQWYMTSKFQSIYQTIEETMTNQLLKPYKLTMSFDLQSMDIFQEDESSRSSALSGIVSAIDTNPSIAVLGMSILGYDLDDEQEDMLEEIIRQRKENTPEDKPDTIDATAQDVTDEPTMDSESDDEPVKSISLSPNDIKDLALWQQMATRFFRKGKGMAVDFEAKSLPESIAAPIRLKLTKAKNELDIVKAFEIEATQKSDVLALAQAINRLADENK